MTAMTIWSVFFHSTQFWYILVYPLGIAHFHKGKVTHSFKSYLFGAQLSNKMKHIFGDDDAPWFWQNPTKQNVNEQLDFRWLLESSIKTTRLPSRSTYGEGPPWMIGQAIRKITEGFLQEGLQSHGNLWGNLHHFGKFRKINPTSGWF